MSVKWPKRKNRSLAKDGRSNSMKIWVLGVFALGVAGYGVSYGVKYGIKRYDQHQAEVHKQEAMQAFKRDSELYVKFLDELEAAELLASSSPRIALAGPVATLQGLERKAKELNFETPCMQPVKALMAKYINERVFSFLAFMQQDDIESARHIDNANAVFEQVGIKAKGCNPDFSG